MGRHSRTRTANDNSPASKIVAARDYIMSRPKPLNHNTPTSQSPNIPDSLASKQQSPKDTSTSLKLAFSFFWGALFLLIATIAFRTGADFKVLASITLVWTGLWASYVSADHGLWRLSEVAIVTALGGLMSGVITTANYFGLNMTLADALILMSILPLPIGFLMRSRICALASVCGSLILASMTVIGLVELSTLIIFMPLIFLAQTFIATKIQSGMAITLAVITAYYWIATFIFVQWGADNLPLTFAAAALFIIGMAHHRFGKSSEDKHVTGSSIHIYLGWVAAMVGALGFQYFWITPEALQNETASLSAVGLASWKAIIIASLGVIFCSAIMRYKQSQITLPGIFLLTASSALIPMILWFPSWPLNIVALVPSINAMEAIGVIIGSSILAASIGMMLNGVRRHSLFMICLGSAVLFAEAALLIRPDLITFDNIIILFTGGLASLTVGGIIAGSSLAHQAPAPRLKHS